MNRSGVVKLYYVCCTTYAKSVIQVSSWPIWGPTHFEMWTRRTPAQNKCIYTWRWVNRRKGAVLIPLPRQRWTRKSTTPRSCLQFVQRADINSHLTDILHFNPSSHSNLRHILQLKMKSLTILAAVLTLVNLTHAFPASLNDAPVIDSVATCLEQCPEVFCVEIWPQAGRVFVSFQTRF